MADDATAQPLADSIDDAMVAKTSPPAGAMALLGIAAGAQIAFGAIGYLVVHGITGPASGPLQLLSGLAFSVGLMMVMVTGSQLFTGNTMLTLPLVERDVTLSTTLRAWAIVWVANLVGSVIIAALFVASGAAQALDGTIAAAAMSTAATKTGKSWIELVSSGMLANMLVCLAVWMAIGSKTVAGKVIAVAGPVTLFVAAGFEHSVANMTLLPIAWFLDPAAVAPIGIVRNLVLATIGNIIGGSLVALVLAGGHRTLERHPEVRSKSDLPK